MRGRLGPDSAAATPVDLRLVPAALGLWLGVLAGLLLPHAHAATLGVAAVLVAALCAARVERKAVRLAVLVALVALLGGMVLGALRAMPVRSGPVSELAADQATVSVEGVLISDPELRSALPGGSEEPYVLARLRIDRLTGRGEQARVRVAVLLIAADPGWVSLRPGQRVSVTGRLAPIDGGDLAAVLRVLDPPAPAGAPALTSRATEPFRQGLRDAVAGLAPAPRGLVPGLVVGDETMLPEQTREAMRMTGLTHLTAVSGTNVTIIVVAALGLARWLGVRGYALPVVATATVVFFVLLARPDPSVLRAAVMGLVGVIGLATAGRKRALPALATAVVVLLLVDPWLGRTIGFTLSVLATAGILVFAPVWRDALRWLPRPVAEGLVVTLAAQVATAPVLVAFAAETSLASVPANVLAAPAVAPATVLGVGSAVVAPMSSTAAAVLAWLAGWPAGWIALVAERGAGLPGAAVSWPAGGPSVVASAALVLAVVVLMPRLLRHPVIAAGVGCGLMVILLLAPSPGWPPRGWLIVACDVGQGDAYVLRAGAGSAVVIDAGPDPRAVDRCLAELAIDEVPLLVLTHFHADHVGGVPGVLDGRTVADVLVSPHREPADQAAEVAGWAAGAGVRLSTARLGEERAVGEALVVRVAWPARIIGAGESAANDASVVVDARVDGVQALFSGDIEPLAQRALHRLQPVLRPDVMTVPHHGSRIQEDEFLTGLGARVALISVGAGNRHGHPAAETIAVLERAGARVWRTDTDGAVAVVRLPDGRLGVTTRGAGVFVP